MNRYFNNFTWSNLPEPHKSRTKTILQDAPEIRKLIGRNSITFLIILIAVTFQFILSWYLRDLSWWMIILFAFFIGAFPSHTLFVCIHETAHNLIFKSKRLNKLAAIIANFPLIFPTAISFQKYHLKHHSFQGVEALDADMPSHWEAKLINNRPFGKILWLLFYPIFQGLRPIRLKEINFIDRWFLFNCLSQIIVLFFIFYFGNIKTFFYLTASFFFSVGLHPLGARWIQEHFLTHGNQETKSYYGPLNIVNLNVGYHNEHHDFPSIPWNKLPQVKKIGKEHYESLGFHTSYLVLLFRFIISRDLSVYSRMARTNRGKLDNTQSKSS